MSFLVTILKLKQPVLAQSNIADAGDVTEVVPLADKSCTLSIIQRVVEYLKKHAEFESTHADDETILAFDKQFQEQSDEIIFQTILAANFLDIKNLLELMVLLFFCCLCGKRLCSLWK